MLQTLLLLEQHRSEQQPRGAGCCVLHSWELHSMDEVPGMVWALQKSGFSCIIYRQSDMLWGSWEAWTSVAEFGSPFRGRSWGWAVWTQGFRQGCLSGVDKAESQHLILNVKKKINFRCHSFIFSCSKCIAPQQQSTQKSDANQDMMFALWTGRFIFNEKWITSPAELCTQQNTWLKVRGASNAGELLSHPMALDGD